MLRANHEYEEVPLGRRWPRRSGMLSQMKHPFLAIVFILGCATGGVASQLVIPPARAGTPPTRWEYLCGIDRADYDQLVDVKTFNRAGAEGWELAAMVSPRPGGTMSQGKIHYCFKRRIDS